MRFAKLDPNIQSAVISAIAALLGAVIGSATTLLSVRYSKHLDKIGKVSLYVRMVHERTTEKSFGFYKSNDYNGLALWVPMWLEICNTSGESKIVRNVSLSTFLRNKRMCIFEQIQSSSEQKYGNNEAYSFVVPSHSVCRYELLFLLHEDKILPNQKEFDRIVLEYNDEKDRIHQFLLTNVNRCWEVGKVPWNYEWLSLKKSQIE